MISCWVSWALKSSNLCWGKNIFLKKREVKKREVSMPYYSWQGVNIFGHMKKGKVFARSDKDLDEMLFARNIALTRYKSLKISRFLGKVTVDDKIHFFRQLAILLNAGVRVPDALMILCDQARHVKCKELIFKIELDVLEGFSLSESLARYPDIFDALVVQVVKVGQESGNFGASLLQLSDYLDQRQAFYKKIKSVSLLPLITLGFFLLITFVIFLFVVPKFADVFASIGKELPVLTQYILGVSNFLRSNLFIFLLLFVVLFIFLIRKYTKVSAIKNLSDKINLKISMYRETFLVHFLRSISMMLKGGVRLVPAIHIASSSIKNNNIKLCVEKLEHDVSAGSSLSQAMIDYGGKLFPQDLIAIVKVGEETARLDVMLDKAADMYRQKISRSILFFTTIFQPFLMVMLGLLITLLIFAIYIPIFGLASTV